MPGVVGYYCDVVGIVLIQRDSHLEVAVHSLVRDIRPPGHAHGPQGVHMLPPESHLTSETTVVQSLDSETHLHSALVIIEPAVGEVQMGHLRLVPEAVSVHIMGHKRTGSVGHQDRRPSVAYLERGRGIQFGHQHAVDEGV